MGADVSYRKLRGDSPPRSLVQKKGTVSRLLCAALICIGLVLVIYEGILVRKGRYFDSLISELQQDHQDLTQKLRNGFSPKQDREKPTAASTTPGIVICAGGNQLLINTYVSVKVLRTTLKSKLPVEIYHVGTEDVGPTTRKIFEEFEDIAFVDLKQAQLPEMHKKPRVWKKYMWKVFSLYLTSFTEVLLLDADSQPLRDPALLFKSPEYLQNGNLFWPDYWGPGTSEAPKEVVYSWLGLKAPWHGDIRWSCGESGQLLFDKSRHADVLEWLWFLNSHAELLYSYMLGDKDTFEMAFMLANKQHMLQRVGVNPGIPLSGPKSPVFRDQWLFERLRFQHETTRYLRLGMLQYGPDLLPAFLHRTERTKFANWKQGYDLDTMNPQYFVPSLGPNVSTWEKRLMWNAHSLPEGMISLNGNGCMLSDQNTAVLSALGQKQLSLGGSFLDWQQCYYSNGNIGRQPIYQIDLLGKDILSAFSDGIAAYRQLEIKLGSKIRLKRSP